MADIIETEDEWFYLLIRGYNPLGSLLDNKFYKCDQFEGLLKCIEKELKTMKIKWNI